MPLKAQETHLPLGSERETWQGPQSFPQTQPSLNFLLWFLKSTICSHMPPPPKNAGAGGWNISRATQHPTLGGKSLREQLRGLFTSCSPAVLRWGALLPPPHPPSARADLAVKTPQSCLLQAAGRGLLALGPPLGDS